MLRNGELTVIGRIRSASNATFLCESTLDERAVHCVYKPVAGEAPLWDFPDGTLAGRERGAYLVSAQLGWNIVPYTIIRHGPAGPGMLQQWVQQPGDTVDTDPRPGPDLVDLFPAGKAQPGYLPVLRAHDYAGDEVVLMHADDIRLWRMAVFDVLVNNADRKGGHVARPGRPHLRGRPRRVPARGEQAADRAVGMGRQADRRPDLDGRRRPGRGPHRPVLRRTGRTHHVRGDRRAAHAHALLDNPVMPGPNRHRPIPWPAF
ncbi:phosphatidylinositol kinase [Mycobacterium timonense]|uniref:Phosphatidylinositol kinase n=1 Tax=Mycobacterium timonense TaxID=701043 RepID=A0A7I9ZF01_9MYCO|nr:phosphatidylinositol kinase [Mycobacterium timonense]